VNSENKKNSNGHSNKHNNSKKKSGKGWLMKLFFATILISAVMSSVSSALIENINAYMAAIILIAIITIGICFDIVGVSVAAADETPFHAMAASKVKGAKQAFRMIKNASKIATFCNDVVGDICSVISGSASAFIAIKISNTFSAIDVSVSGIIVAAFAAGLNVFGKGLGKTFAMANSTKIVYRVAIMQYYFETIFRIKKSINN